MAKGMIVYAYALRRVEPNPCNIRLARAAQRIITVDGSAEGFYVVAQRSVAKALGQLGIPCIEVSKSSGYEGSEQVTDFATQIFRSLGITEVVPVAQTFLQINKCIALVKKAGFKTWPTLQLMRAIGWIGFDPESIQPRTRGLIRQVLYTARQILFGYRYPPELSE